MLIKGWGRSGGRTFVCLVCGKRMDEFGSNMEVCPECIRDRWDESRCRIALMHSHSRSLFQLPLRPPRSPLGVPCNLCSHECKMAPGERGYCGIRTGDPASIRSDGRSRARLSFYYDPLPTNCVADWVCAGGTGAGYPEYANDRCAEVGFHNLAVFLEACNFNCLYCQNWHFKRPDNVVSRWHSVDSLASAVTPETSCICFFGGDPGPQIPYAVRLAERARRENAHKILRICWETNGSVHPSWMKRMGRLSLASGGCIKIDLKAWDSRIHRSLCGVDNRRVLDNFAMLSEWTQRREVPPFLIASTVLVPEYVGVKEVAGIASFIARLNPAIPYTLLAFAPQFYLEDFPTTSRRQAEECLDAARQAGLERVILGNRPLVH